MYETLRAGASAALAGSRVRVAYLFGSQARGDAAPDSDTDVAVLLDGASSGLDLRLDLIRRLHRATGVETEILVLEEAPLRVVERVLRDGRLLYSVDEAARVEYEARMRRVCADFALRADRLDRALLAATAEGLR